MKCPDCGSLQVASYIDFIDRAGYTCDLCRYTWYKEEEAVANKDDNVMLDDVFSRACDTTLNAYQYAAECTSQYPNQHSGERLCQAALGLAGEAGECADYVKKVVFHKHELDKEKLAKELGDVLWYVAEMASALGMELETVAEMNIDKLKKRYPSGFSSEASINREME